MNETLPPGPFTSYARDFEDVMLVRALGEVERGCYVDVGVDDPVIDSVSLAFHRRGWPGVHVATDGEVARRLELARPGDRVLEAAPAGRADRGAVGVTLARVLAAAPEGEIHWLRLAPSGGGVRELLASWGRCARRPWIVLVAAGAPAADPSPPVWEPTLRSRGYAFAWFDGYNRFYVHSTRAELRAAFRVPPNAGDRFTLSGTSTATFHHLLTHEIVAARRAVEALRATAVVPLEAKFDAATASLGRVSLAYAHQEHVVREREFDYDRRLRDSEANARTLQALLAAAASDLESERATHRAERETLRRLHDAERSARAAELGRYVEETATLRARVRALERSLDDARRDHRAAQRDTAERHARELETAAARCDRLVQRGRDDRTPSTSKRSPPNGTRVPARTDRDHDGLAAAAPATARARANLSIGTSDHASRPRPIP